MRNLLILATLVLVGITTFKSANATPLKVLSEDKGADGIEYRKFRECSAVIRIFAFPYYAKLNPRPKPSDYWYHWAAEAITDAEEELTQPKGIPDKAVERDFDAFVSSYETYVDKNNKVAAARSKADDCITYLKQWSGE